MRHFSAERMPRNGRFDIERRIDRQEGQQPADSRPRRFGHLIAFIVVTSMRSASRSDVPKSARLSFLDQSLGGLRLPGLDRDRLINFGKERALEGAGPVTFSIDLGYIKTIFSHAAAVHGVLVSTETIDLARIALGRLGLVGKGLERDRRPTQNELDRVIAAFEANTTAANSR